MSIIDGMKYPKDVRPYYKDVKRIYNRSEGFRLRAQYYDSYMNCSVKDKTIMYEAFFGRSITCNPGELFRYILKDPRFEGWQHIWSLEESEFRDVLIEEFAQYDNVRFVIPNTKEYFDALSSSKYLVNNVTWQTYFTKKPEQILVNTWHGIPLKYIGFDVPNGNVNSANIIRNFIATDYVISPVEFTTDNFKYSYKLDGLFEGKIIETGYPRIDATFNSSKQALKKELERHGVPYDENKKLILYAPTWKGEKYASPDLAIDEYDEFLEIINSHIDTDKYQVLFKPHQIVYKTMTRKGIIKPEYIPATVNTNLLLGETDVLISDYSSIFFDFLVTERPVYFYIPDLEEYLEMRGLYSGVDELPGPIAQDVDTLGKWLENIDDYKNQFEYERYTKAAQKYTHNDDGHVCERIVEAVFFGDETNTIKLENKKKKLLFHMDGILLNGIAFSLFNLINNLDYDKYDVTFFSQGQRAIAEPYLAKFPEQVRVMYRTGPNPINLDAEVRRRYCDEHALVKVDNNPLFPEEFYEMEYDRCFAGANFDCIINFSGFSSYYVNILFSKKSCRQIIWMHSVMQSEYNRQANGKSTFKEKLDCIYKVYPYLDKYVSCSNSTMLENRRDLAKNDTFDRFGFAKNLIDANRVLKGRDEKQFVTIGNEEYMLLEEDTRCVIVPRPNKSKMNFVTIGRLSDEKNYFNLISAFAKFNKENPDARLYIIGDGPNKSAMREHIIENDVEGKVILTGNLTNPFSVVSECDCFILPSFYEGQPMVLLEARVLGLPIIMSNFATAADSVYDNGQLVIGMEEEDILDGLEKFKNGEVPNEFEFDYKKYNEEAIAQFESNLE